MELPLPDIFKAAGGVTKLARTIGLQHQTLLGWRSVPLKHVPAVSNATGIPKHKISKLWDAPEDAEGTP